MPDTGHAGPGDKMRLFEFFNPKHDSLEKDKEQKDTVPRDDKLEDTLYWFILDNDRLHKKYFLPLAFGYHKQKNHSNFDRNQFAKKCIPMVIDGCKEYCKVLKTDTAPEEMLDKELFRSLAHRLVDQIIEDVKEDAYGFKVLSK